MSLKEPEKGQKKPVFKMTSVPEHGSSVSAAVRRDMTKGSHPQGEPPIDLAAEIARLRPSVKPRRVRTRSSVKREEGDVQEKPKDTSQSDSPR